MGEEERAEDAASAAPPPPADADPSAMDEPEVQTAGTARDGGYEAEAQLTDAVTDAPPAPGISDDVGEPERERSPRRRRNKPPTPLTGIVDEADADTAAAAGPPDAVSGGAPSPAVSASPSRRVKLLTTPGAPPGFAEGEPVELPPAPADSAPAANRRRASHEAPPAALLGQSPNLRYADPDEEAESKGVLFELSEAAANKHPRKGSFRHRTRYSPQDAPPTVPKRRRRQLSPVQTQQKVVSRKMQPFANGRTPPLLRRNIVNQQTQSVRLALNDDELFWQKKAKKRYNMNSGIYALPRPQAVPPVEQCIEEYRQCTTRVVDVQGPAPEVVHALTTTHAQGDATSDMTISELLEHARGRSRTLPKLRRRPPRDDADADDPTTEDALPQQVRTFSVKQAGTVLSMTDGMKRREPAHIVQPRTIPRVPIARTIHREDVAFSLPPSEW